MPQGCRRSRHGFVGDHQKPVVLRVQSAGGVVTRTTSRGFGATIRNIRAFAPFGKPVVQHAQSDGGLVLSMETGQRPAGAMTILRNKKNKGLNIGGRTFLP